MNQYFLLCCMLINFNLTAHDANDHSTEKLTEVLQKLEQQINKQKEDVDNLQAYTTYAPWLIVPGGIGLGLSYRLPPAYYAPDVVMGFYLCLCGIGISGIFDRFDTLPEEQRELETREQKRAELLKQLKDSKTGKKSN